MKERYRLAESRVYDLNAPFTFSKTNALEHGNGSFDYQFHDSLIAWWPMTGSAGEGNVTFASDGGAAHLKGSGPDMGEFPIDLIGLTAVSNNPVVVEDTPFDSGVSKHSLSFSSTQWVGSGTYFSNTITQFGDGSSDTPFSISMWVKKSDVLAEHDILSRWITTGGDHREWKISSVRGASFTDIVFTLYDEDSNSSVYVRTNATDEDSVIFRGIRQDVWYHVVVTYDGRGGDSAYNGMRIYVNGVYAVDEFDISNNAGNTYDSMRGYTSTLSFALGHEAVMGRQTGAGETRISETAVWNKVLTESAVEAIYNAAFGKFWIVARDYHKKGSSATMPIDDMGIKRDITPFHQGVNVLTMNAFYSGLCPKLSSGHKPHVTINGMPVGYRTDMYPELIRTTWFDEGITAAKVQKLKSPSILYSDNFLSKKMSNRWMGDVDSSPMRLYQNGAFQFASLMNGYSVQDAAINKENYIAGGYVFTGKANTGRALALTVACKDTITVSFRVTTGPWWRPPGPNNSFLDDQFGTWLSLDNHSYVVPDIYHPEDIWTIPDPNIHPDAPKAQPLTNEDVVGYGTPNALIKVPNVDKIGQGGGAGNKIQNALLAADTAKGVFFTSPDDISLQLATDAFPLKIQWSSDWSPATQDPVGAGTWHTIHEILPSHLSSGPNFVNKGFQIDYTRAGAHGPITVNREGISPGQTVYIRFYQAGPPVANDQNWVITDLEVLQTSPATTIQTSGGPSDATGKLGVFPNFEMEQMNFGQPKTFVDGEPFVDMQPADGSRRHTSKSLAQKGPFSILQINEAIDKEMLSGPDGNLIVENHNFTAGSSAYDPTVHLDPNADWLEWPLFLFDVSSMDQYDGVIEFFRLRGEISRKTTESPFPGRSVKGSVVGPYAHDTLGRSNLIHQFIFYDVEDSFNPYEDSVSVWGFPQAAPPLHRSEAVTVNIEGYVSNTRAFITPWIDSTDWDEKVDGLESNKVLGRRDEEMASIFLKNRESTTDLRPRGHKSAAAGFYYDNAQEGTDSIAFGGLKK